MLNYYQTDFFKWEQPLINKLRESGLFVYGLRSGEDGHTSVENHVFVNNVGFVVTDKELDLPMSEERLFSIGTDSVGLRRKVRAIAASISNELTASKAEWESKEAEREKAWEKVLKKQDNRMERDRHYKLSTRKDNPVLFDNGYGIRFQTIYDNGDGSQNVMYFIRNADNKIVIDSTETKFKKDMSYNKMAKEIAKKHGIVAIVA